MIKRINIVLVTGILIVQVLFSYSVWFGYHIPERDTGISVVYVRIPCDDVEEVRKVPRYYFRKKRSRMVYKEK